MSEKPHNDDQPLSELPPDVSEDRGDDSEAKEVRRKLRYDAPTLDIPRPLYLRADDDESDEDAA